MQRPSSRGKTQQQRARRILVRRIIFDDLRPGSRRADFRLADVPLHRAPESMTAELIFARRQLPLNFGQGFHSQFSPGNYFPGVCSAGAGVGRVGGRKGVQPEVVAEAHGFS